MANIANLLTEHMAIWTAADTQKKSGRGRASGNAGSVYGVKKLRELILELAVRGKLVPQDPNDEPASELLKRIQAEKAKLIAEGKLKKEKPLAPISEEEKPFEIPKNWEWQRLPETYYSISPRGNQLKGSEIKETGTFPVVDQGQQFISGYTDIFDLLIEIPHPIIVFGDHTTNIKLIDFDFVAGADGTKLLAPILIYPRFYYHYLSSYILENRGYARHFKVLNDNLIAIPPLAEQHRIVAKVDELMALCDQLEQQHSNAQEAHETLVSQLLATLTQSQNTAEFNANWQRIYVHFDVLFTTEASIDALKQTLLQLAVMGKLVPQDPNDEPASELLKRIQVEKAKLIAEGKLKKEKPLAPIGEDEKPFEISKGWEWSKVLDCSVFVTDGEHATPKRTIDGLVPLVTAKNVRDGYMDYDDTDFVDILIAEKCWNRCKPEQDDLLMVSVGATLGRLTILHESKDMVIVRSVTLIRPCLLNPLYLSLAIKSPLVQQAIWGSVRQMAQPGLYLAQSSNLVIPLPPLSEQHRIVAKVDELMTLCDQLKTHIQQANQKKRAIADALVVQAVMPRSAEIINFAKYRTVVACYTIKKMCSNPAFGRTQAMKLLYLAQNHVGIVMQMQFEREAAGPLDKWIYEFERQGESEQWFSVVEKSLATGKTKVEYQIKSAITAPSVMIESICSNGQRKELDRLLGLFADKKTEEAEIIATLFAAWNDFLIDGKSPTDDEIVQEVRENWHERKARFTPEQLYKWINWLRKSRLIPQGKSPHTIYQQQLIH